MIITRTPFRLTLGGGGTDLPSFYREHGGFILSVAVDKYMYLNVNAPILDDKIRVKYAKTELVDHVDQVEHTLAREALRHFDITRGIEIVSIADIPAGTGLGSSSAYLVGLLNAMHALTQNPVGPQQLAEEACHIELEILKKPIGKQDQYMAAFGGLTILDISPTATSGDAAGAGCRSAGGARAQPPDVLHTRQRDATAILRKQDSATKRNDSIVVSSLREIKDIGIETCSAIVDGNLRRFGELMDIHWQTKKRLAEGITNPHIDAWYDWPSSTAPLAVRSQGAGRRRISDAILRRERGGVARGDARGGIAPTELPFRFRRQQGDFRRGFPRWQVGPYPATEPPGASEGGACRADDVIALIKMDRSSSCETAPLLNEEEDDLESTSASITAAVVES